MKRLALILALSPGLFSQAPADYYSHKRIVWYDRYDHQGSPWLWGSSDKRGHFAMGALAGSWVALWAEHQGLRWPWLWGAVAGAFVGVAKEVYDYKRGSGTAEIADAMWTGIGGAAGALVVKIRF